MRRIFPTLPGAVNALPPERPAPAGAVRIADAPDGIESPFFHRDQLVPAPLLRQLALQAAAVILVLSLAWPYYGMQAAALPWLPTSLCIGGVAFTLAALSRQPPWWKLIHAAFMPLAWAAARLELEPAWFLLAFAVLLLVYRGALTGQVPLYLSGHATVEALAEVLAGRPRVRFIDLGAGIGSTLVPLAGRYPDSHFTGIENAPLTWAAGWLRTWRRTRIDWRWGDLWRIDLGEFDVVYAFLSPAPMPSLWDKVCREMRPGSLFISNSFAVPGVEPARTIEVDGAIPRTLYCYER